MNLSKIDANPVQALNLNDALREAPLSRVLAKQEPYLPNLTESVSSFVIVQTHKVFALRFRGAEANDQDVWPSQTDVRLVARVAAILGGEKP